MSFLKSVLHENQWTCILRIGRSCIIANQFHSVEYPFWSFTWKPIDMHTVKTSQKFKTFHINITRSDKYASILLISFCFEPPILMKKKKSSVVPAWMFCRSLFSNQPHCSCLFTWENVPISYLIIFSGLSRLHIIAFCSVLCLSLQYKPAEDKKKLKPSQFDNE